MTTKIYNNLPRPPCEFLFNYSILWSKDYTANLFSLFFTRDSTEEEMPPAHVLNPLEPLSPQVNLMDTEAMVKLAKAYLETKAFHNYTVTGNKSKTQEVKDIVKRFLRERLSLQLAQSPVGYTTLVKTARTKAIEAQGNMALLNSFAFYPSSSAPLDIRDSVGNLLGAHFSVPLPMIKQLEDSTAVLAAATSSKSKDTSGGEKRGFSLSRHFIAWCDSAKSPFMSAEYREQEKEANTWLQANDKLWQRISNQLRLLAPHQFVKMEKATHLFYPGVKPLCAAYHGVCLNQGVEDPVGSATHRDVKDDFTVFNAVAPFGNYKGGDLVLWGLRMRVEMQRGDVFFFYGSLISHNVTAVEGDRNSVNLFTHHSTLV
jgi:hypothetical protein